MTCENEKKFFLFLSSFMFGDGAFEMLIMHFGVVVGCVVMMIFIHGGYCSLVAFCIVIK